MARLLLIDTDTQMFKDIGTYLSWYGFSIDVLEESAQVMSRLAGENYDLLVSSAFAEGVDGYRLCSMIRQSREDAIRRQKILLFSPEELDAEKYLFLKKNDVYVINKYANISTWCEKINSIIRNTERAD